MRVELNKKKRRSQRQCMRNKCRCRNTCLNTKKPHKNRKPEAIICMLRGVNQEAGIHLPQDSDTAHLCILPKEASSYFRDTSSTMFIVVLFIIVRYGDNLSVCQWMNG